MKTSRCGGGGNIVAQYNLGMMYRNGWGVLTDYLVAHICYNIPAANEHEIDAGNREKLAKLITPEDVPKAKAMARVCVDSNYEKCVY